MLHNDLYWQRYHLMPNSGWMNDPNGLVYSEGEYHFYYQSRQLGCGINWGHMVSTDLINWAEHPDAIRCDEAGEIISGSAVVDWNNSSHFFDDCGGKGIVAIYTTWKKGLQTQTIAYSRDNGYTFTKYIGNPVIDNPGTDDYKDFRDPKVFWHEETQKWIMVVAGGLIRFYSSIDLKNWALESEYTGNYTECPDLFKLPIEDDCNDKRWVLSYGGTSYEIGSFDGHQFVREQEPITVDFGLDFYAVQSFSDVPEGRRIWIAWLSNWKYADKLPYSTIVGGPQTIIRDLSLYKNENGGIRLRQRPIKEYQSIHKSVFEIENKAVTGEFHIPFQGSCYVITAEIDIGTANEVGLIVRENDEEKTVIYYKKDKMLFGIDRTKSGIADFHPEFIKIYERTTECIGKYIKFQVFVDESSVEAFLNDGKYVASDLIFPSVNSQKIKVYAVGGSAEVIKLNIEEIIC